MAPTGRSFERAYRRGRTPWDTGVTPREIVDAWMHSPEHRRILLKVTGPQEPGSFQVYDREGQPCPSCEGKIRRIVQLGRSTFYCPSCQR